jgi:hypothetical protein
MSTGPNPGRDGKKAAGRTQGATGSLAAFIADSVADAPTMSDPTCGFDGR